MLPWEPFPWSHALTLCCCKCGKWTHTHFLHQSTQPIKDVTALAGGCSRKCSLKLHPHCTREDPVQSSGSALHSSLQHHLQQPMELKGARSNQQQLIAGRFSQVGFHQLHIAYVAHHNCYKYAHQDLFAGCHNVAMSLHNIIAESHMHVFIL